MLLVFSLLHISVSQRWGIYHLRRKAVMVLLIFFYILLFSFFFFFFPLYGCLKSHVILMPSTPIILSWLLTTSFFDPFASILPNAHFSSQNCRHQSYCFHKPSLFYTGKKVFEGKKKANNPLNCHLWLLFSDCFFIMYAHSDLDVWNNLI